MSIPLEDTLGDIIGKAMRGLGLAASTVAERTGLSPDAVAQLRDGAFDESAARQIAPVLGLNAEALIATGRKSWSPALVALEGLAQFNTAFDDMTVNAYLVWDPASKEAAAFDTGGDAGDMLARIEKLGLKLTTILLTHTHGDHIFDLDRLKEKTGAPAFVGEREPLDGAQSFAAGRTFQIGALQVESRLTWGHSPGGITYVIRGLAKPVAIVGDAIFAGSMGGGGVSYADALRTNREEILTLPDETIVCAGHGPMTTVGEEKRHNPFLAT
jgi:glyoxylase-like metal-dependent hydrolase (beta-lactamase superfamily II)